MSAKEEEKALFFWNAWREGGCPGTSGSQFGCAFPDTKFFGLFLINYVEVIWNNSEVLLLNTSRCSPQIYHWYYGSHEMIRRAWQEANFTTCGGGVSLECAEMR